jgi:predicted permease
MALKTPVLSAAVVLSLALAIGTTAAIFALVNAVALGTVPVHEPEDVVAIYTLDEKNPGHLPTSEHNWRDVDAQAKGTLDVTAFTFMPAKLALPESDGTGQPAATLIVAADYFDVLGVPPVLGRGFEHDDSELGAHPEVVLSHAIWQERFGARESVIGEVVRVNGHAVTVIGVAPEGFHGTTAFRADLFVPMSLHREVYPAAQFFDQRRFLAFFVLARLAPGVSIEQANAELERIATPLAADFPADNEGRTFAARPLSHALLGPDTRGVVVQASALMMTIASFVLLIACANAANLMLARATSRRAEIAVRSALGATPVRIVRQVLTESLCLAALSGLLGVALAYPAADFLWSLRPGGLMFGGIEPHIDQTVLMFTGLTAMGAGVLFGLAPALRCARVDLVTPLKEETAHTSTSSRANLRSALVVAQVALSMVALIGAGLFVRSMENMRAIDPGFNPEGVLLVDVNLSEAALAAGEDAPAVMDAARRRVIENMVSLPDVDAASWATITPLEGGLFKRTVYVDGREAGVEDGTLIDWNVIGPGYFEVLEQPLLAGRDLTEQDDLDHPLVVVVNAAFVDRYWPGGDAVGQRIRFLGQDEPVEIVGVVETVKYANLTEDPLPVVYSPFAQSMQPRFTLHLTTRDAEATIPSLAAVRRSLGVGVQIANPRPLSRAVEGALFAPRSAAILLGSLGAVALVLASIGIYGLMAYSVRQRTREIGIRMALGAKPGDVVRFILLQALSLVVLGIGVGVAGGIVLQNALSDLLWEVPAADPLAFGSAALVLAALATVAGYLPARHATKISPTTAMRKD